MTEQNTTCTIRIPNSLKTRLDIRSQALQISLNQLIVDILNRRYTDVGFAADQIIQVSSRQLRINIDAMNHPPGMPQRRFVLHDSGADREFASYVFGLSHQFMWQLNIEQSEQYEQLSELGMALLHYFNNLGRDISRLEWDQFPTQRNWRILQVQDAKTSDGRFISSVEDFLGVLKERKWIDRLERVNGHPSIENPNFFQDIMGGSSAQPVSSIALVPIGPHYSAAVLNTKHSGTGITGGQNFNNLKEVQDWLTNLNILEKDIPKVDFDVPIILIAPEVPLNPPPQTREKVLSVIERAVKQAQTSYSTVVFTTNNYQFKVNGQSDAEEEYSRYWECQRH
jgi:hypothetical protein